MRSTYATYALNSGIGRAQSLAKHWWSIIISSWISTGQGIRVKSIGLFQEEHFRWPIRNHQEWTYLHSKTYCPPRPMQLSKQISMRCSCPHEMVKNDFVFYQQIWRALEVNQIRRLESNGCYSPDDGSDGAEERDALDIGIDSVEEID